VPLVRSDSSDPHDEGIFRREAWDARADIYDAAPLRISPRWADAAFWTLAAVLAAALSFAVLGSMNEYAEGPALVRLQGKQLLAAPQSGRIRAIHVRPGTTVPRGTLLAQLDDSRERSDLSQLDAELAAAVRRLLVQPRDDGVRQALAALHARRQLLQERIARLALRAPVAGTVSDLRIRVGQHLAEGEPMLAMVAAGARAEVIALLPGKYLPQLRPGQPLRVRLEGFRGAHLDLPITGLAHEVVGPEEVRRYLGPELGDAVPLAGPVAIAVAQLDRDSFTLGGHRYRFHDGLPATAAAVIRRRSILVSLVPGLQSIAETRLE
jgi:membrane fusion protein (multidrug efflux system)